MKKFIASCLVAVSLSMSVATPARAAIVGAFGGSTLGAVFGGLMMTAGLGGGAGVIWGAHDGLCRGWRGVGCAAGVVASLGALYVGFVILDGEQQAEITFAPIDAISKLNERFTEAEIATFNHEVDRLNAITQTILSKVAANPEEDAAALWDKLGTSLSHSTLEIAGVSSAELLGAASL